MSYVGRFAPSPTGPLHIGSLVTAVASFLHARQAGGRWLVRIEDIDPPREVAGAADAILRTLEAFGLEWDGPVVYQSSRFELYRAAAQRLLAAHAAFRCDCSRSAIRAGNDAQSSRYPGTCRDKGLTGPDTAVRALVAPQVSRFVDGLQGALTADLAATQGDYVIVRRDGLPAYHLAVVVDDAEQLVTSVVRGIDLLDSTPAHLHLQAALGLPSPSYYHLPVVVNAAGQKLSKQTGAMAVTPNSATAVAVLELLGAAVPHALRTEGPPALWRWAMENWTLEKLRARRSLAAPAS